MVAILLSTYNGEKFLKEQINSIQNQTYKDFILYIADDGSNDKTLYIIDEYLTSDTRIVKLKKETKNQGACISFMWLLSQVNAEFYFFCDQDDIWVPNKIEKHLLLANKYSISEPLLIHSDLKIVDDSLNVSYNSFWKFNGSKHNEFISFKFHCAYNNIPGCAMLINKKTRDLSLPFPITAKMHDAWISLVASYHKGNIVAINEPLVLYRQHSNNTIGAKQTRTLMQKFYNINLILKENINLYKTVNKLYKVNFINFILNKTKVYISLTKH